MTNPSVTDRGFTGHRQNNTGAYDLKLVYMNARYYHPQLGRFISPDTIVPNPENPQSYNRYSYVRNSPLNLTDPTGHKECVDSNVDRCEITVPHELPPKRPKVEVEEWEKQLLAIAAFVEMHGHGDLQAMAIIWVILNRVIGLTDMLGNGFDPNANFSDISLIAGYALVRNQMYIGQQMQEYGLLELVV